MLPTTENHGPYQINLVSCTHSRVEGNQHNEYLGFMLDNNYKGSPVFRVEQEKLNFNKFFPVWEYWNLSLYFFRFYPFLPTFLKARSVFAGELQ